jgi:hypothetical protein
MALRRTMVIVLIVWLLTARSKTRAEHERVVTAILLWASGEP